MTARHIGIIVHDFSTGGSERIAIRLGNTWAKAGRRVTIYCGTEVGALRSLVGAQVELVCCDPPIKRSLMSRVRLGLRLSHAIKNDRPDVIFMPGNYHLLVVAVLARLHYTKRPLFICKLSNPVRSHSSPGVVVRLSEWFTRIAMAPVSAFTAMSPALREQAVKVFPNHPIFDLAEPILDDDLLPLDATLHADKAATIVCAGRLAPQKDFALALRAFSTMDPALNVKLVIYGEGPLFESLTALAAELKISERVSFAGYVSDLRPYLAEAKLFLMTSIFEGYPAVLIEALAAGVPVVTTDCTPAMREIISSIALGHIVKSRDPQKIALAIETRLKVHDASREVRIAATQKHAIKAAAQAYLDCFDTLGRAATSGSSQES